MFNDNLFNQHTFNWPRILVKSRTIYLAAKRFSLGKLQGLYSMGKQRDNYSLGKESDSNIGNKQTGYSLGKSKDDYDLGG